MEKLPVTPNKKRGGFFYLMSGFRGTLYADFDIIRKGRCATGDLGGGVQNSSFQTNFE